MADGISIDASLDIDLSDAIEDLKKLSRQDISVDVNLDIDDNPLEEIAKQKIAVKATIDSKDFLSQVNKLNASIDNHIHHTVSYSTFRHDSIIVDVIKQTSRDLQKSINEVVKSVYSLKPNLFQKILGLIGNVAASPFKLAGNIGKGFINNIFTGLTEEIGKTLSGEFVVKGIKKGSQKIKSGINAINQYVIGTGQVFETFLAETLRSGDISKAGKAGFRRSNLAKQLDRLQKLQTLATQQDQLDNILGGDKELEKIYNDILTQVNPGGGVFTGKKKLEVFQSFLKKAQPTEIIDAIVNPTIKELQPLLKFIQGMQSYRTNVKAQEFYNQFKANFPILQEGEDVLSVIGGAQFAQGEGGRKVAQGIELLAENTRVIPVTNPETDNVLSEIDDKIKQLLTKFAPDFVENKDLLNTAINALRQVTFAVNPMAFSTAAAQAIANTRLAQEQGRLGNVTSFSLGGADAVRTAQAMQYAGIENSNILAMAYPFLNLTQNTPNNFTSTLLSGDPLNFPFNLGIGFQNEQQKIIQSTLAGAEAHAYKHLFKIQEFVDIFFETINRSIPDISPRTLGTIVDAGGNLYELLGAAEQLKSIAKTGEFDYESAYKGFKHTVSILELLTKFAEFPSVLRSFSSSRDTVAQSIGVQLDNYYQSISQDITEFLKKLGVNLPDDLGKNLEGYLKYLEQAQKINETLETFKRGTVKKGTESYFSGELDPIEAQRRLPVLDNETIKYFRGAEGKRFGDYQQKIVEGYEQLRKVVIEFIERNGQLTKETIDNIELLPVDKFSEDVQELLSKTLNTFDLPREEDTRALQVDVPEAFKKTKAAILAYNQLLGTLGSDVLPAIKELQQVAYGMSGAAALLSNRLVYKTDLDPDGLQKIASKQEIKAYERLQGRLSPLLYQGIEGKALVTERIKGRSLKEILERIAKPYNQLQESLSPLQGQSELLRTQLNDAILGGDEKNANRLQQELSQLDRQIRDTSNKINRERERFNKAAKILYRQVGQLGSALQQMGIAHGDLASGNVYFAQGGITSIDLGNAKVDPTTIDKTQDQVTTIQRAVIDRAFYGLLDVIKVTGAITSGYRDALPIPEKRQIDESLLSPINKGKEIPLGSETPSLLKQILGEIQSFPKKKILDIEPSVKIESLDKLEPKPIDLPKKLVIDKVNEKLLVDAQGDVTPDKGQIQRLSDLTPQQVFSVAVRDAAVTMNAIADGGQVIRQGFNQFVSAVMPVINTLYRLDYAAKETIYALDLTGLAKLGIKSAEFLAPAIGFAALTSIPALQPVGQLVQGAVGNLTTPLAEAGAGQIGNALTELIVNNIRAVPLVGNQIANPLNQALLDIVQSIFGVLNTVGTEIIADALGGAAIKGVLSSGLDSENKQAIALLKESVNEQKEQVKRLAAGIKQSVADLKAYNPETQGQEIANLVKELNSKIEQYYTVFFQAKLAASQLPKPRKKGSPLRQIEGTQSSVTQNINLAREMSPDIITIDTTAYRIPNYKKQAQDTIKEIRAVLRRSKFEEIGQDTIEGWYKGIRDEEGNLVKAIRTQALKLPEEVKKVLGIASPSRVFRAIGQNIVNSTVLGIEENLPNLLQSAYRIRNTLVDAVDIRNIGVPQNLLSQLNQLKEQARTQRQSLKSQSLTRDLSGSIQSIGNFLVDSIYGIIAPIESNVINTVNQIKQSGISAYQYLSNISIDIDTPIINVVNQIKQGGVNLGNQIKQSGISAYQYLSNISIDIDTPIINVVNQIKQGGVNLGNQIKQSGISAYQYLSNISIDIDTPIINVVNQIKQGGVNLGNQIKQSGISAYQYLSNISIDIDTPIINVVNQIKQGGVNLGNQVKQSGISAYQYLSNISIDIDTPIINVVNQIKQGGVNLGNQVKQSGISAYQYLSNISIDIDTPIINVVNQIKQGGVNLGNQIKQSGISAYQYLSNTSIDIDTPIINVVNQVKLLFERLSIQSKEIANIDIGTLVKNTAINIDNNLSNRINRLTTGIRERVESIPTRTDNIRDTFQNTLIQPLNQRIRNVISAAGSTLADIQDYPRRQSIRRLNQVFRALNVDQLLVEESGQVEKFITNTRQWIGETFNQGLLKISGLRTQGNQLQETVKTGYQQFITNTRQWIGETFNQGLLKISGLRTQGNQLQETVKTGYQQFITNTRQWIGETFNQGLLKISGLRTQGNQLQETVKTGYQQFITNTRQWIGETFNQGLLKISGLRTQGNQLQETVKTGYQQFITNTRQWIGETFNQGLLKISGLRTQGNQLQEIGVRNNQKKVGEGVRDVIDVNAVRIGYEQNIFQGIKQAFSTVKTRLSNFLARNGIDKALVYKFLGYEPITPPPPSPISRKALPEGSQRLLPEGRTIITPEPLSDFSKYNIGNTQSASPRSRQETALLGEVNALRQKLIANINEGAIAQQKLNQLTDEQTTKQNRLVEINKEWVTANHERRKELALEIEELTNLLDRDKARTAELKRQVEIGKNSQKLIGQTTKLDTQVTNAAGQAQLNQASNEINKFRQQVNVAQSDVLKFRTVWTNFTTDLKDRMPTAIKTLFPLFNSLKFAIGGFLAYQVLDPMNWWFNLRFGIESLIGTIEKLEASKIKIETFGGSFEDAIKTADRFKVSINTVTDGYAQLTASTKGTNLEGIKTQRILDSVAQSSRVFGLSAEDTSGFLLAMRQILSGSTLQLEELNQISERLPSALALSAKAMRTTTGELRNLTSAAAVSSEEFAVNFAEQLRLVSQGGLGASLTTIQSERTELLNEFRQLQLTLGEVFGGTIKGGINFLTNLAKAGAFAAKGLSYVLPPLTAMAAVFTAYKLPALILATSNALRVLSANAAVATVLNTLSSGFASASAAVKGFIAAQITLAPVLATTTFSQRSAAIANTSTALAIKANTAATQGNILAVIANKIATTAYGVVLFANNQLLKASILLDAIWSSGIATRTKAIIANTIATKGMNAVLFAGTGITKGLGLAIKGLNLAIAASPLIGLIIATKLLTDVWGDYNKEVNKSKEELKAFKAELDKAVNFKSDVFNLEPKVKINRDEFEKELNFFSREINKPFGNLLIGVTNALTQSITGIVIQPIKSLVSLLKGNVKGALSDLAGIFKLPVKNIQNVFAEDNKGFFTNRAIIAQSDAFLKAEQSTTEYYNFLQRIKAGEPVDPEQITQYIASLESRNQQLRAQKGLTESQIALNQSTINQNEELIKQLQQEKDAIEGTSIRYSEIAKARQKASDAAKKAETDALYEIEKLTEQGSIKSEEAETRKQKATLQTTESELKAQQDAQEKIKEAIESRLRYQERQKTGDLTGDIKLNPEVLKAIQEGNITRLKELGVDKKFIEDIEKAQTEITDLEKKSVLERLKLAKMEKEEKERLSKKRQDKSIKDLENEYKKANILIEQKEQERAIAIKRLRVSGGISRAEAEEQLESSTQQRLSAELKAEEENIKRIQQLKIESGLSETDRENAIEDKKQKLLEAQKQRNNIIVQLLDNQISKEEKLKELIKSNISEYYDNKKGVIDIVSNTNSLISEQLSQLEESINRAKELSQLRFDLGTTQNTADSTRRDVRITRLERAKEILKQLREDENLGNNERKSLIQELAELGVNSKMTELSLTREINRLEEENRQAKLEASQREFNFKQQQLDLERQSLEITAKKNILDAANQLNQLKQSRIDQVKTIITNEDSLKEAQGAMKAASTPREKAEAEMLLKNAKDRLSLSREQLGIIDEQIKNGYDQLEFNKSYITQLKEINQLKQAQLEAERAIALEEIKASNTREKFKGNATSAQLQDNSQSEQIKKLEKESQSKIDEAEKSRDEALAKAKTNDERKQALEEYQKSIDQIKEDSGNAIAKINQQFNQQRQAQVQSERLQKSSPFDINQIYRQLPQLQFIPQSGQGNQVLIKEIQLLRGDISKVKPSINQPLDITVHAQSDPNEIARKVSNAVADRDLILLRQLGLT